MASTAQAQTTLTSSSAFGYVPSFFYAVRYVGCSQPPPLQTGGADLDTTQFLVQLRSALDDSKISPVLVERDGDSAVVHLKFANATAKQQLRLLVGNGDKALKSLRITGAQEGDVLTLWPTPQGSSVDMIGGLPVWVLYAIGGVAGLLLVALLTTCITCCCWRAKRKRAKRLPMETGGVCAACRVVICLHIHFLSLSSRCKSLDSVLFPPLDAMECIYSNKHDEGLTVWPLSFPFRAELHPLGVTGRVRRRKSQQGCIQGPTEPCAANRNARLCHPHSCAVQGRDVSCVTSI